MEQTNQETCECGGEFQELFYWLNGEQGDSTDEAQCEDCGKIIPMN